MGEWGSGPSDSLVEQPTKGAYHQPQHSSKLMEGSGLVRPFWAVAVKQTVTAVVEMKICFDGQIMLGKWALRRLGESGKQSKPGSRKLSLLEAPLD